jgi:nucleoside-diphosphate-sugar epimerase
VSGQSVLVIGGTGYLGQRITDAFVRAGYQVAVLSRGQRAPHDLAHTFEDLRADRRDRAALQAALASRSFDIVVDNVAYEADDAASLLMLLDGRVGRYLLTSSTAVYANRFTRRPIREDEADLAVRTPVDDPDPFHSRLGHAYANGKRAVEQAVRNSRAAWTILRPPVIVGADDRTRRVWWFVQRLLDGGPIVIPDWGPGRVFQVAWTEDVARAFVAAAGQAASVGRTYNVAETEIFTAQTWIAACAQVLDLEPRWVRIPEAALADHRLDGYALPIAGRPFGHMLLDTAAIRGELGFEPSPERVWLSATMRGSAAHPPESASAGYERREAELRVATAG